MCEPMKQTLDMNPQFQKALSLMRGGRQNLFITGRAGTGKSTLLNYFCSHSNPKPVALAPTGVAALNIKGQTIHNFFKFYVDITPEKIKQKKSAPKNAKIYKNLKTLIIDEISMVRADLLDCVDTFLRRWGPTPGRAFGGAQMIFVGDLYQLPPVVTSTEKEMFSSLYKTPFFFSSRVFQNFDIEIIELEKIYRQKDQVFTALLNRIRNNSVETRDLERLNSRFLPSFQPAKEEFYIHLTSRNKQADGINEERLKDLRGRTYSSKAFIEGNFGKEYFPTNPDLKFKVGAQIMFLNNDSKKRWVNGTMGIIESVNGKTESIRARLYSEDKTVVVQKYRWEIYHLSFSKEKQTVVSELAGAFTQFPFKLAWAITIHKSQGKTFDRVIIDLGPTLFAGGQAYVALSRCASFEGIVLKAPVKKHHIRTDYRICDFLTKYQYRKAEVEMPVNQKIKLIQKAIKEKNRLTLTYLKADDTKSLRTVKPLEVGLRAYQNKTFQGLQAFCFKAGEERTFRLDRILKLNVKPVR